MSEQRSSPLGVRNDLSRDRSEVLAVRGSSQHSAGPRLGNPETLPMTQNN
jgi:hypothetical protein